MIAWLLLKGSVQRGVSRGVDVIELCFPVPAWRRPLECPGGNIGARDLALETLSFTYSRPLQNRRYRSLFQI
jgi:hypothetical protein